ncbi:aromatic acid exporter family protein [Rhodococcus sp. JVH1]|uniref:aromatic acid exporter family protein n=1 Tax=Rhodococcus sp. JVH1 TaxID=745408 RepID=UPI00027216D8|nr:aromatic acid exporter family protein [Rhodococcus sp. JVH1]EJJ02166.1 integral membrane domain protein [Rhodococcus sp. JVH1]
MHVTTLRRLRSWAGDGQRNTVVVQSAKAATAAVLAWILAERLLGLPQPFLAPYAAVFMIEVTVSRSLRVAGEQLAAVSLGVLLAAAVGMLLDSVTVGVGVAVLTGLLLGRWHRFGSSGVWVDRGGRERAAPASAVPEAVRTRSDGAGFDGHVAVVRRGPGVAGTGNRWTARSLG